MMVDNDIIINDNINYSNDDEIIILLINNFTVFFPPESEIYVKKKVARETLK